MTQAQKIHLIGIILYTFIANFSAKFFDIHWIHIFNGFMLSSILYNLLDFKFVCEEGNN